MCFTILWDWRLKDQALMKISRLTIFPQAHFNKKKCRSNFFTSYIKVTWNNLDPHFVPEVYSVIYHAGMYSVSSETSKTELFANIIIGFQPWCHEIIRTYLFFPEVCLAVSIAGVYSVPSQTSKIELFAKIVNSFQPLTIFVKSSTLDVSLGSECASIMKKEEQMRNKYVSLIWMVKLNLVLDRELSVLSVCL